MASGSVLIVDNRGGWRQMVEHGKTGWLCGSERDFIYYASKSADGMTRQLMPFLYSTSLVTLLR